MKIIAVKHDYPERAGFAINRPFGRTDYTFLHFEEKITVELDGQTIITEPNACILFSPKMPQFFYSKNKDITHNWMHFTPDAADLISKYEIPENRIMYLKDSKFISRLFYKMEIELNSNNPFKEELLNSYFNEFLIRFSRSFHAQKPTFTLTSGEMARLQNVRKTALSTPEENWSIEELAKLVNLSPSRFHALYKAAFGISPLKDIIENRIQTAKNMLIATDFSVSEISERLGYQSTNHFIRQFKNAQKQTPLSYRKNYS